MRPFVYKIAIFTFIVCGQWQFAYADICGSRGPCISEAECLQGLISELGFKEDVAKPYCQMKTSFREWDVLRLAEVFPALIEGVKAYRQHGIFYISAIQLLLFTYHYLPVAQANAVIECSQDFTQRLGISLLRAHDNCEALYRFHSVEKRELLMLCSQKQMHMGVNGDQALSRCIRYIFFNSK